MAVRALASGQPDTASPMANSTGGGRYLLAVVAVLLVMAALGGSGLANEVRFFAPGSLVSVSGDVPVPQEDRRTPALDAALQRAALHLSRGATCVIAYDSWRREYFRASYLLMPRRVWPAVARQDETPISAQVLTAALAAHRTGCLIAPPGVTLPAGLRRITSGAVSLYLRVGSRT